MNSQLNTDLEKIRLVEKSKRLFDGRFSYVIITPTEQKLNKRKLQSMAGSIDGEINPSLIRKLFLALVMVFLGIIILKILITPVHNDMAARIIISIVYSTLIVYLLNIGFFSKKYNYSIFLNFEGISVGEDYYPWGDISQTAILQIGSGRGQREHLILVFKDGNYKKYPLEGFLFLAGPGTIISTYVEYFRKNKLT